MSDGITFEWLNIPEFDIAIDDLVARVKAAGEIAVARGAAAIEAAAKVNASGRPGPNVVTGTLRRSIHTKGPTSTGTGYMAQVGPSVIYGRRIELGFHGTDSLGRNYNQQSYPYLRPALETVGPRLEAIMAQAWAEAIEA